MGYIYIYTGFWWGNLRERDHLEDPGIDGRIMLRWIFRQFEGMYWIELAQVRHRWQTRTNYGNEPSGSIK
jgi:hypothetical protein